MNDVGFIDPVFDFDERESSVISVDVILAVVRSR
jgi:hypothetical protein